MEDVFQLDTHNSNNFSILEKAIHTYSTQVGYFLIAELKHLYLINGGGKSGDNKKNEP